MKNINTILLTILSLAVTAESRGQKQAVNNDILKVDVTKNYSPKKELILQDFMDVEYIPLETNDEFVNQGIVRDIGKKFIVVTNGTARNGDIFIYNRTGKAIRKINHKGHSGEEYTNISWITLDEDNNEMFVNDYFAKKILVYDLKGKFKRSFKPKTDSLSFFDAIYNYDKDHLICCDIDTKGTAFVLISKQDGSITKKIEIPFKKKKFLKIKWEEISKGVGSTITTNSRVATSYHCISIPYDGNWMLFELSSDTVYTFLPDYSLRPFFVRTPSIQSMNPEVFLRLNFFSDRYYFMEAIKCVYDFKTESGFPRTSFMYDKQEKAFFGYTIYNGDYSTKKEIFIAVKPSVDPEVKTWKTLEPFQLIESYKKGELKGKLKEIAAKLDAEDNPVIMLIKHKK